MALAGQPKLLLLDEPTGGMSPEERRVTGELLQPIRAWCALLIVEHDLDFIKDICDRLTVLDQGRVLDDGTVERDRALGQGPGGLHHPCLSRRRSSRCSGSAAGYGRSQVLFDVSLSAPRAGARRDPRPQRRRQDHAAQDPDRRAPADGRRDPLRRPRCRRARHRAPGAPRHGLRAAGAGDLRHALGAREPAARRDGAEGQVGHRARARPVPEARPAARPAGRHALGRRAQDAGHGPRPARPPEAPAARRADRGRLGRA